jgi:hypothetical protein|tara:strand:- start:47 stop:430 length:384 start_codon:yes stop_codon:yes gene_type:complete
MEKYLYFRTADTAADDDQGQDSVCYPLSAFRGFSMGTAGDMDAAADEDAFTMVFESLQNDTAGDDANFDLISINITTDNNAKDVWKGITEAFAKARTHFIVVGDDVTGEYVHSDIESVGAITLVDAG